MSFPGLFDSFARAAAPLVIAALWQGMVVVLGLALCLRFTRRLSATQRFVAWFAGFWAVVALPLLPLLFSLVESGHALPASSSASPVQLQFDVRWTYAIAGVWLLAFMVRGADLVFHVFRLRRLWRTATPIEVPALPESRRKFEVCATRWLDRPSVIGFFAPRVLIPDWLLTRIPPDELQQIIVHEAMHLARRDDWSNLLQKLCLVLSPFNPALWVIDRQLAKEREMACDEAVVRITRAPRAYAACLASLAERGLAYRKEALSLGAWQRRSELASRVHRILRGQRGLPPAAARLLMGALGCSLLVVTLELARCPQLVAFVPPATAAHNRVGAASEELGDAVYPTNPKGAMLTPGVHIVQARAEMPASLMAQPLARRAHAKSHAEGALRAASPEPGAGLRDLRAPKTRELMASPAKADASQQVVVFTAWEQIETTAPASQAAVADYDTQPAADGSSGTSATETVAEKNDAVAPGSKTAQPPAQRRATVTQQLILRIVPSSSKSKQPMAIPLGDGWLVIQL